MKTLTLYFTTTPRQGIGANLIRWFQGTPFSHVAIGLRIDSLDRNIVYEATLNGVVCQNYDNWIKSNKVIFEHPFKYSDKEYKDIQRFCIDQLGKPYGFRNILAIMLGRTKVQEDPNTFICSELAYVATKNKFKDLFKTQDVVTPKDLYNEIINKYGNES